MIEFKLSETPPSKNTMKGSHWGRDKDVRDKWNRKTCEAVLEQVEASRIDAGRPWVLVVLFFWTSKRRRDVVNYVDEGVHGIQDGLVDSQLLQDDDYKHIKAGYVQHGIASDEDHTIVRLVTMKKWVERLQDWIQP